MATQPEIIQYDAGIYQIEIVDPVDGGVGSKTNAPLLGLANRTAWLKKHVDDLESGALVPEGLAPKNSPQLTGSPTAPTQLVGDASTKLANDEFVNRAVNGSVSVNVAGGVTVTLTQAQYGFPLIVLTGAITANIAVVFPTQPGKWQVINNTTGAFTVTCKTAAGSGTVVSQAKSSNVFCDGVSIVLQQTDFISPQLTGNPTAPTAAPGTNTTQLANTAFVQAGLLGKQDGLGFTPVQQGTGVGQLSNIIKIGWNGSKIKATVDLTDMGNLALEASPSFTGTPTAPTAPKFGAGAPANQLATLDFIRQRGHEFNGVNALTTSVTLTTAYMGSLCVINNAGGQTFTLPAANSVLPGSSITFYNVSSQTSTCQIARQGTNYFYGLTPGQTNAQSSIAIRGGDSVTLTMYASDVWVVSSGQMATWLDAQFTYQRSMGANGWQKLPGGMIIQWGAGLTGSDGKVLINFPIVFPNAGLGFVVTPRWNDPAYSLTCGTNSRSTSQAWIFSNYNAAPITIGFDWIATGY